jgi:hypothetical protein
VPRVLRFTPMSLARLHEPFKHPHWLLGLKSDGFRALAVLDREGLCLVSRRGDVDGTCGALGEALRRELGAPEEPEEKEWACNPISIA